MQPREIAARALGIAVQSIASVETIKHGLTNESWLVRASNDAVVVRISSRHWTSLQIDRHAEDAILATVARAGIGADVVAADVSRGVLVTRYLGPTCSEDELVETDAISRLGATFRHLHSLTPPSDAREVHLPTVIAGYLDTLHTLNRDARAVLEQRDRGLSLANEIAQTCSPRLCHNDVHHLNVIDGEPLRFIDWEYAGIGEPYFDLASVCVYHNYSMRQRAGLLTAYQGDASATALSRLSTCCWLFEYVRDLWTEVRAAVDDQ